MSHWKKHGQEPPEGWTKKEWDELVTIVQSKDKARMTAFLEKYSDYSFGTPLALDIAETFKIDKDMQRDLVERYGSFIPVHELLKELKEN